jgi:hypothetical protein
VEGHQAGDRVLGIHAPSPAEVPDRSIAEERILWSGEHDLRANPAVSVISGTPGTGIGWPSISRGTLAQPPESIEAETVVPVEERRGRRRLQEVASSHRQALLPLTDARRSIVRAHGERRVFLTSRVRVWDCDRGSSCSASPPSWCASWRSPVAACSARGGTCGCGASA